MSIEALLDTIDILRKKPEAVAWFRTQQDTVFALPVLVAMELINGMENKIDQQRVTKALEPYPVVQLTAFRFPYIH